MPANYWSSATIKVSGVALQVGFSSPQRFNAAFRKHMGKTPMEYRKQTEMKEVVGGRRKIQP